MLRSKSIVYIIILVLCLSGCAALQRKFVRKKKKQERLKPVITLVDYSKDLRVDELYKKYFLFWKTSHQELIERLDFGYKKRKACYGRVITNLMEMQKYLTGSKKEEIGVSIVRLRTIEKNIVKRRLSKSKMYKIKQLLEKVKRQINREFLYSKVKECLEAGK